jgi:hypothetical protein
MDMVEHFCLAVLTAAAALAAALIVAVARRRPLEPGHLLAAVSAVAARAPPIGCVRLTQLCVLRRWSPLINQRLIQPTPYAEE